MYFFPDISTTLQVVLPLVDDFKLDAFGLNNPFESSVGSVNVESELLFELRTAAVLHRAGFVPLGVLLHTNVPFSTDACSQHRLKTTSREKDGASPSWEREIRILRWRPGH